MSNTEDNSIKQNGFVHTNVSYEIWQRYCKSSLISICKGPQKQEWKLFPMKRNVYLFLMSFYIWKLPQCTLIRPSLTFKYFSSLFQHKSKDFLNSSVSGQEN